VLEVEGGLEISLHLKLPGDLSLERAHAVAEQIERAIGDAVPEVSAVRTHLEPLAETAAGEAAEVDEGAVETAVREETGAAPRELRFVRTDDGIVAFLTVGLGARESLAEAHDRASALEERVRSAVPGIADVVVRAHADPSLERSRHPNRLPVRELAPDRAGKPEREHASATAGRPPERDPAAGSLGPLRRLVPRLGVEDEYLDPVPAHPREGDRATRPYVSSGDTELPA